MYITKKILPKTRTDSEYRRLVFLHFELKSGILEMILPRISLKRMFYIKVY